MAALILLNKSFNYHKEKCLISKFMNINEKQKEETKLISIYGLASLHTSERTSLKHNGKRDLLNVKMREKS